MFRKSLLDLPLNSPSGVICSPSFRIVTEGREEEMSDDEFRRPVFWSRESGVVPGMGCVFAFTEEALAVDVPAVVMLWFVAGFEVEFGALDVSV